MSNQVEKLADQAINEAVRVSGDDRVHVGSGIHSTTAVPLRIFHEGIVDRIEDVKRNQSLLNALEMTEDELDFLVTNFLLDRHLGGKSSGSVRLYFESAQDFAVPRGSAFETDSGLRFFAASTTNITRSSMSFNTESGLYFMDVPLVVAEAEGPAYDVSAGSITSFAAGGQSVVSVRNQTAFSGGLEKETNEQLLERIRHAVTVRDYNVRRAIYTILRQTYPEVAHVLSTGYGDPETQHDKKFGVNVGGNVYAHLETARIDVFEDELTLFDSDLQWTGGGGEVAQVGFIRRDPLVELSKPRSSSFTFAGGPPAFITLDATAPDTLDSVDSAARLVIRQLVTGEEHSFPPLPTPVIGGTFVIDNPGRLLRNLVITAQGSGERYFCGVDFNFDPTTGTVTRLSATMSNDVSLDYQWEAVIGVDYEIDHATGVVTAGADGYLDSGDTVLVEYSYFRDGKRDDTPYTITSTPVWRVKQVLLLDPDGVPIEELAYVPPVETDDDTGFDLDGTIANAPASKPWWTARVMPFRDIAEDSWDDRDLMIDSSGLYETFRGISTAVPDLVTTIRPPWPTHGCLRYTVHEEVQLLFVNPDGPAFDSSTRIKVIYETPTTVAQAQTLFDTPDDRVLCSHIFARCFPPAVVDLTLYARADDLELVKTSVSEYIDGLLPGNALKINEIAAVALDPDKGGATRVITPFRLQASVQFPSGRVATISSTGEIDIDDSLELLEAGLAKKEFVSSRNVGFRAGTIEVKAIS